MIAYELDVITSLGLAAVAGALADWDELPAVIDELYAARREARDRPPPDLG